MFSRLHGNDEDKSGKPAIRDPGDIAPGIEMGPGSPGSQPDARRARAMPNVRNDDGCSVAVPGIGLK